MANTQSSTHSRRPSKPGPARFLAVALLAAALWWLLSKGAPSGWLFGAAAVAAATWSAWRFPSGGMSLSPLALLRMMPFFIGASLRGGWDVALRAFGAGRPLAPALVWYATGLPAGGPRVLLANCISLLPGTLTAAIDDDAVLVHVLDRHGGYAEELALLERQVARVYRLRPEAGHG